MLKIGDMVKVIGKTNCGTQDMELIPIGTVCRVSATEYDDRVGKNTVEIESLDGRYAYWYFECDVEKGHLEWIKDEEEGFNDGNQRGLLDKSENAKMGIMEGMERYTAICKSHLKTESKHLAEGLCITIRKKDLDNCGDPEKLIRKRMDSVCYDFSAVKCYRDNYGDDYLLFYNDSSL